MGARGAGSASAFTRRAWLRALLDNRLGGSLVTISVMRVDPYEDMCEPLTETAVDCRKTDCFSAPWLEPQPEPVRAHQHRQQPPNQPSTAPAKMSRG